LKKESCGQMKTFKCDNGKMVLLDNSSGDFIYKNDLLLFLERERRFVESQIDDQKKRIENQEKQENKTTDSWNKDYLEMLKDRLSIYNQILTVVNK